MLLVLALPQKISLPAKIGLRHFHEKFGRWNQKGIMSVALLAIGGFCVVTYIAALYWTFQLGFTIQKNGGDEPAWKEANIKLEFKKQQKILGLADGRQEVLRQMEKVSEVRYVAPTNVAVSAASVLRQEQR